MWMEPNSRLKQIGVWSFPRAGDTDMYLETRLFSMAPWSFSTLHCHVNYTSYMFHNYILYHKPVWPARKYKLWSFCNALLPNQFVFAKLHVIWSRWRYPSKGRVVVIMRFCLRSFLGLPRASDAVKLKGFRPIVSCLFWIRHSAASYGWGLRNS